MKIKSKYFFLLFFIIISNLSFSELILKPSVGNKKDEVSINSLNEKYKKWLELVHYIITREEKEIFFKLKNNRERDIFIKLFWKQRDPTPGTPENEFKEELIKRFNYANKYFKYGSGKPGWRTDRGMIYIILGPPVSRHNYINVPGLYPIKVWSYYGKKEWGLPPFFYIVFYQKLGAGEFKLYDPNVDGPLSLLEDRMGLDRTQPALIYNRLEELLPSIAPIAFSLIPEHGGVTRSLYMSPRSTILLSKIKEVPEKMIDVQYARNYIKLKGIVKVDENTTFIKNDFYYEVKYEPEMKINFVHFSIKPNKISVSYSPEKDKYFFAFRLDVSLRKDNKIIFQYSKNYSFYYSEKDLESYVKAQGISIEDFFPAPEGKFKLCVLLQNSVKSEFTYVEKDVLIRGINESIHIFGPYVTHVRPKKNFSALLKPFNFNGYNVMVDPKRRFSPDDSVFILYGYYKSENLKENIKLILTIKERETYGNYEKKYENIEDKNNRINYFLIKLDEKLKPGYYDVKISVFPKKLKIPLAIKENYFYVAPISNINHPIETYKVIDKKKRFIYHYWLGAQYQSLSLYDKAERYYDLGFKSNSEFSEGIIKYANFLIIRKNFNKARMVIEKIKDNEKYKFDYFSVLGKSYFGMGKYKEALQNLLEANKVYDSDYNIINLIGYSYLKVGRKKDAIKAFRASLFLNKKQVKIKKVLSELLNDKDLKVSN